jgi:hypothetical protein
MPEWDKKITEELSFGRNRLRPAPTNTGKNLDTSKKFLEGTWQIKLGLRAKFF